MKLTGSEILLRSLVEEGVDTVFGIPGGVILHTYDVMTDAQLAPKIRHILCRHEQGATHAAEGYYKPAAR